MTNKINLDPSDLIVALDPGLKHTGIAIGTRERLISLSTCSISHKIEAELPHIMAAGILAFTNAFVHRQAVQAIVLEDYAINAPRFNIYQAELVGVIKHVFWHTHKIPVYSLPQSTGRKLAAGNGKATKSAIFRALRPVLPDIRYHMDWERVAVDNPGPLRFHASDAAAVHIGFSKYLAAGAITDSFYRRTL
jgi:Holliday junction resolvasome RuvABC endonuclease subunit